MFKDLFIKKNSDDIKEKSGFGRTSSMSVLIVILFTQFIGIAGIFLLKYEMDIFSMNYKNQESMCHEKMQLMDEISSAVFRHEVLIQNYILTDSISKRTSYKLSAEAVEHTIDSTLEKYEKIISGDNERKRVENLKAVLTAYRNGSAIACDIVRNNSTELAVFFLDKNLEYYVNRMNETLRLMRVEVESMVIKYQKKMEALIINSRLVFILATLAMFVAIPVCLIYCTKILKLQNTYMLQAEEASKAKSDFLSNMSHEIRTPINVILGLNEMIIRETSENDVLSYSKDVKNAGETLLGIVNDVLDFSKIEAGRIEIIPVEYNLRKILRELYNMMTMRAKGKPIDVIFDVDKKIPSLLYGDDLRLHQIVVNLLTNAIKYTKEGSVTLAVSFDMVSLDEISLRFSVKDTGIGMKEEEMEKLMKPFERLDEKANHSIEGTGLGLSITGNLLALMDSSLKVKSEYGKGSEFYFCVKQKIMDRTPIGDVMDNTGDFSGSDGNLKAAVYAPGAKILAVDDTQLNLTVIRGLLKRTGVQITAVSSGREAVKLALEEKYDLILMDHRMPDMDGVETLHHIKGRGKNKSTPAIALTANAIHGAEEYYMSEGFDGYLTKPVKGENLEEALLKFLSPDLLNNEPAEVDNQSDSEEKSDGFIPLDEFGGDESLLLDVIKEYIAAYRENRVVLTSMIEDGRAKDYTIKVHALKSSSKLLNNLKLSDMALNLEMLGNKWTENIDDSDVIKSILKQHPVMMEEYGAFTRLLCEKYSLPLEAEKTVISDDELKDELSKLSVALEEFNSDIAEDIVRKLSGSIIGAGYENAVSEILSAVSEDDYDIALEKIQELLG